MRGKVERKGKKGCLRGKADGGARKEKTIVEMGQSDKLLQGVKRGFLSTIGSQWLEKE